MTTALGARLASAAKLVRQGAYLADIGTDHAYLPIFLLKSGKIERALCSDVNEGPLLSAKRNALEAGLSDKVEFTLADGLDAAATLGLTDIAICGMGGELIADIIDRAPFVRTEGVRLILQPMTKQAHLRRYLARCGFAVREEIYSAEADKFYLCLCAEYTGECREISDLEAELGLIDRDASPSYELSGYLRQRERALTKCVRGKIAGGESSPRELVILNEIGVILNEKRKG